jgi:poly(A) polymerase
MKKTAIQIVRTLQNAGHQAVFAGGYVRDQLLGVEPKDIDIATSATPDQVKALFDKTVPVGEAFGVVRVLMDGFEFEVTTFREDAKTGDGRRPDSVKFSTMQTDAMRRDLTINGMFWDPITGILYDFVGGKKDLQAKTIRFIGDPNERIEEDALRMLRVVRFAVKFDATLADRDALAISNNGWRVEKLSGERVFDEMTKILRLHKPRKALTMLSEFGILERILPEVQALTQCLQGAPFHCEGATVQRILR